MNTKFPALRTLLDKSAGISLNRRLTLSLLAIILLFALNVATHFWGSFARTESMFAYRNSVSAQQLATAVSQQLEEQRKQILVLATLRETTVEPLGEEDRRQAREGLRLISNSINRLGSVTHEDTQLLFDALWKESQFLLPAWQQFYSNYNDKEWRPPDGKPDAPDHYDAAWEHLLALEVQQRFLAGEQAAVIDRTIAFTDRINAASFFASILLSSILGFFLVRYTRQSLGHLKMGAQRFGSGDLHYRIEDIKDTGGTRRPRPRLQRHVRQAAQRHRAGQASQGGRRRGQPGQEPVPHQCQPRVAHAAECHHRLRRDAVRRAGRHHRGEQEAVSEGPGQDHPSPASSC